MGTPNFENRTLYYGDNLPALRRMNSETVHLIATDPPFKKQRGFFSDAGGYDDRWTWQKDILGLDRKGNAVAENHDDWIDQIQDDWPKAWSVIDAARTVYGDDMGAFLCWLGVRLMEMHRILRDDGSIYVHLDSTAVHYVKGLMDAIFGRKNFRNEIVWKRSHSHNSAKRYGPIHDTLLFYSKTDNYLWTDQRKPYEESYVNRFFKFDDHDGRGRYWTGDLTGSGIRHGETGEDWRGFNPTAKRRHWMYPPSVLNELDADNRIYWPKTVTAWPKLKRYLSEAKGVPLPDIVDDIYSLQTMGGNKWERTGYPTQKPLGLYERIISASTNPGDIVLDPFCGCATTPVAAERLGRQWVGMDIWEMAYAEVTKRLKDSGILVDDPDLEGKASENGMLQFTEYRLNFINNKDKGEEFPARTDDNEVAAPSLRLRTRRPTEPWQQLSNALMRRILIAAQGRNELVGCAGCGRLMESDFFHLDHISPKSEGGENYITNRILICAPCNSRKSNTSTLTGLQRGNRREGWMKDRKMAEEMQSLARMRAEWIRDEWGTEQCAEFMAGLGS